MAGQTKVVAVGGRAEGTGEFQYTGRGARGTGG